MAQTAKQWSINALSVELEMDRRTLGKIVKNIPPADVRKDALHDTAYYWMADVVKALLIRDTDESKKVNGVEEKGLLDQARRRKVELEIAELEGELCRRDDVYRLVSGMIHASKAKIRGLPSKVLHRVMACETYEDAIPIMTDAIDEALNELSDADFQS